MVVYERRVSYSVFYLVFLLSISISLSLSPTAFPFFLSILSSTYPYPPIPSFFFPQLSLYLLYPGKTTFWEVNHQPILQLILWLISYLIALSSTFRLTWTISGSTYHLSPHSARERTTQMTTWRWWVQTAVHVMHMKIGYVNCMDHFSVYHLLLFFYSVRTQVRTFSWRSQHWTNFPRSHTDLSKLPHRWENVASFSGLSWLQFLIACSYKNRAFHFCIATASDQNWR